MGFLDTIQQRIQDWGYKQQQGQLGHTGSWGLPEFGITEAFAAEPYSYPTTSTGGASGGWDSPEVLGTQTQPTTQTSTGGAAEDWAKYHPGEGPMPTGYSGEGGGPSPEEILRQQQALIGGMAEEQYGYLGKAEEGLRGDYPNILADIGAAYQTQLGTAETGKAQTERQIAESGVQAGTRKQDAMAAATRLYNELLRGGQQRYGGASSAGQAYGELAGVEQQRRAGEISRNFETTMRQIDDYKVKVNEDFNNTKMQLQQQKQLAVNEANRDFQNKLLEINRLRVEVGTNKAQMRLSALQDLRNQVFQIDLQNKQFEQSLQAQKYAADLEISTYQKQLMAQSGGAQGALGQFQPTTSPQTGLTIREGGSQAPYSPVGQVYRKPEEEENFYTPRYSA